MFIKIPKVSGEFLPISMKFQKRKLVSHEIYFIVALYTFHKATFFFFVKFFSKGLKIIL